MFFCFFKLKVCAGVAFLLFFSDSQELVPLILLGWGLLLGTMAVTSENDVNHDNDKKNMTMIQLMKIVNKNKNDDNETKHKNNDNDETDDND